jgi:hypothetical protein
MFAAKALIVLLLLWATALIAGLLWIRVGAPRREAVQAARRLVAEAEGRAARARAAAAEAAREARQARAEAEAWAAKAAAARAEAEAAAEAARRLRAVRDALTGL